MSAFSIAKAGDRVTITVTGKLEVPNRQELKAIAEDAIEDGANELVIDFAPCIYVDASGLGVLVSISKRLRETSRRKLQIVNVNADLWTLFELSKLDTLFDLSPALHADADVKVKA